MCMSQFSGDYVSALAHWLDTYTQTLCRNKKKLDWIVKNKKILFLFLKY
jgi:hypothetical protein